MSVFRDIENMPRREVVPGYHARFVHGDRMTVAFWEVEAGSALSEHAHEHEQIATVIEGQFELTVDGEPRVLDAGTVAVIPSNVPHSGRAITDCRLMDVFVPVREDYL